MTDKPWPKHANGRNKKIGEMNKAERDLVFGDAIETLRGVVPAENLKQIRDLYEGYLGVRKVIALKCTGCGWICHWSWQLLNGLCIDCLRNK